MCRLFGSLSKDKNSCSYYIFESKYSLYEQAVKEENLDGWGFGSYEDGKISFIAKSIQPLNKNLELAKSIVNSTNANLYLFFIRKASNPRNLKKELLLTIDATQPFSYDDILFAHNGTVYIPDELENELSNYKTFIKSLNDSEVYFASFIKFYKEDDNVIKALKKVENLMFNLFERTKSDRPYPFSSLNVMITKRNEIYAYNRYIDRLRKGLKDEEREYYRMVYFYDEEKLIIASEPLDDDNWIEIGDGKFVKGFIEDNKVKVEILE
jgi:predicted glutamine amidotransferase